jgi:DNA repair ATPase RecN
MSETTLPQVSNRLERLEEIVHANAIGIQTVQQALLQLADTVGQVTQLQERSTRRHQQHDLELDDQDERTERLEKIIEGHETKMEELKEIQADVKSMLAILLRRSIPEA